MTKTLFAALTLSLLSFAVPAQSRPAARGPQTGSYDIMQQPGSPIQLTIDEAVTKSVPAAPVFIRNDGGQPVSAVVLRVDAEADGLVSTLILGSGAAGLASESVHVHGLGLAIVPDGAARPLISVDYVLFANGDSWGADTLGRSKLVQAYREGRGLALTRLQKLLTEPGGAEFDAGGFGIGTALFTEGMSSSEEIKQQDFRKAGYDEIVNTLKRMRTSTATAQDFAQKLDAMPLTTGQ